MCWRERARRWPGVMRQLCRLNRNSADELPHKLASLGFPGKVSDLLQWVGRMRSPHRSCVMRQLCRVRTSCRGLVPPKPSRPVVPFPRKHVLQRSVIAISSRQTPVYAASAPPAPSVRARGYLRDRPLCRRSGCCCISSSMGTPMPASVAILVAGPPSGRAARDLTQIQAKTGIVAP